MLPSQNKTIDFFFTKATTSTNLSTSHNNNDLPVKNDPSKAIEGEKKNSKMENLV